MISLYLMLFVKFLIRTQKIFPNKLKFPIKMPSIIIPYYLLLSASLLAVIVRNHLVKFFECELLVRLGLLVYENTVHQIQNSAIVQILSNRS